MGFHECIATWSNTMSCMHLPCNRFSDHPRMTCPSPTSISSGSNRHWVFNILNAPFRTWSRTWALLHLLLFCFQTFWSIGLMNHSCTLTMAPSTLNLPTGSMTAISSARALNSLLTNLSSVRDQCDLWLYSDAYCVTLGLLGCLAFPLNTRGTYLTCPFPAFRYINDQ